MSDTITNTPIEPDHEREAEGACAELLRRAEAEGIKPFASLDDLAGDAALTADFDVDEFLHQVREDRDRAAQ